MGVIIIEVLLIIILFLLSIEFYYEDWSSIIVASNVFLIFVLIIEILSITFKPIDYKNFKAQYEVIKEMSTESNDLRDINYTEKIIEINTEIKINRELKDSFMVGIFFNKDIAELELLSKDGE